MIVEEKNIGDLYNILAKSFDLQQQILHTLLRVETSLKSQTSQQSRQEDGSSNISTPKTQLTKPSNDTTIANSPSLAPISTIIPPLLGQQFHTKRGQSVAATHDTTNNTVSNTAYIMTKTVDAAAVHAPKNKRNKSKAAIKSLNTGLMSFESETRAEQAAQQDDASRDLLNDKQKSSSLQHEDTIIPEMMDTSQSMADTFYLPSPSNHQGPSTAASPEQIMNNSDAFEDESPPLLMAALKKSSLPTPRATRSETKERRKAYLYLTQKVAADKHRDVAKTPPNTLVGAKAAHSRIVERMYSLVAYLSNKPKGRKFDVKGKAVESKISLLRSLATSIYCHMVKDEAQQKKNSIENILKRPWAHISADVQLKYIFIMEKIALQELQLDFGRCINCWGGRSFLREVSGNVNTVTLYQKYLNKIEIEVNEEASEYDAFNKEEKAPEEALSSTSSRSQNDKIDINSLSSSKDSSLSVKDANANDYTIRVWKSKQPETEATITKTPMTLTDILAAQGFTNFGTRKYKAIYPNGKNNTFLNKPFNQENSSKATAAKSPSLKKSTAKNIFTNYITSKASKKEHTMSSSTIDAPGKPAIKHNSPTIQSNAVTATNSIPDTRTSSAKSSSSISLESRPIRLPVVVAADDSDDDKDDEFSDALEESFLSFFDEDANRKRSLPDKEKYESISIRKKEKLTRQ